jgi:hypothetical protein
VNDLDWLRLRTRAREAEAQARKRASGQHYAPQHPSPRQKIFLDVEHVEAFYGGAAGGGKSSALLMAALEYVDTPGYSALLLRRTYQDLSKPGALLDRAREWLSNSGARWNEQKKQWRFPSGAVLAFGYLENEADIYQYQGAEYQFVGFDELTQFTERQYTYLFSRLRRLANSNIPLRLRAASNPGGIGAAWVQERFIPEDWSPEDGRELHVIEKAGRAFVPARLVDNPHLDQDSYRQSLENLDDVTRAQLLEGDWQVRAKGNIYPMWEDGPNGRHVITWSQFEAVFGSRYIPTHWKGACGQDWGFDPDPCATVWNWCAGENGPLAGSIFCNRILTSRSEIPDSVGENILLSEKEHGETSRIEYRVMSHEASTQRETYRVKLNLSFTKWKPDVHGGIAQMQHYLRLRELDKPHPFKPWINGQPLYYVIVPDEQLVNPKGDDGLALLREEFAAYRYTEQRITEARGAAKIVPYDFFNHFMDAQRGIAARWFPDITRKTEAEKLEEALPAGLRIESLATRTGSDRDIGELMRQFKLDTYKREQKRQGDSWSNEVVSTEGDISWGSDDTNNWE